MPGDSLDLLSAQADTYQRALYESAGNISAAARRLGIRRTTLRMRLTRMEAHGIVQGDPAATARDIRRAQRRHFERQLASSLVLGTVARVEDTSGHADVARAIAGRVIGCLVPEVHHQGGS